MYNMQHNRISALLKEILKRHRFQGKIFCESEFLILSNQNKTSLTSAEKCCPLRTMMPFNFNTTDIRLWVPGQALTLLSIGLAFTTGTTACQIL